MKSDTLEKVLAYVDAHIHEKINLNNVSDIAGYSPFYFSKFFSEAMGMPLTGYIRLRKLQHAVVSLLGGARVLDVALLYAFDSHEGFTRSFKQLFGSTPSTVRKHLTSYAVPAPFVPDTSNGRLNMDIIKTTDLRHNMHQLVFEVLENSLEEARAGYCTSIEVALLPGRKVKIADNGRGMPLSGDQTASKAVLDKILAGRPITNAEYSQMGDLVKAGMQTVNSLCESLQIIVSRDGRQFRQDYIRGIAQHDLRMSEKARPSGTEIILVPDKAIFGDAAFSENEINAWLQAETADITNLAFKVHCDSE